MAERIVLVNVSGQPVVFNLPHQIYCSGAGECRCHWTEYQATEQAKAGIVRRVRRVRTPDSITVLSRQTTPELHPAVLQVPEVKAALQQSPRRLMVKGG